MRGTGFILLNTSDDVKEGFDRPTLRGASEYVEELCSGKLLICDSEQSGSVASSVLASHQILNTRQVNKASAGFETGDSKVKQYIQQYALCLWLLQVA
jgi:hypothetical protein